MSEIGRSPEDYLTVKVSEGKIERADADLLLQYIQEQQSTKGLSDHSVVSNTRYLAHTVEVMPNPAAWTTKDILKYKTDVSRRYKKNTARKHIILTRGFIEWLISEGINKDLDVKKYGKAPASDRLTKTSAMMLRDEDVSKIIAAGRNTRDRCMLSMLAESGMRPHELLGLTWEELQIDNKGVVVNVAGKTGVPRFIRLVTSTPYVSGWRNDHPAPANDHHIFVSLHGGNGSDRVTHAALKKVVRLAAARAGITKHVNPYLFRHSNVTRMLEEGYSDSTIRMTHWGSQTTSMLGTYGHVSPQAVDKEILAKSGLITAEKKEPRKVDQCSRCYAILTPTQEFCPACGLPQTEDAARDETTLYSLFKKFMATQQIPTK